MAKTKPQKKPAPQPAPVQPQPLNWIPWVLGGVAFALYATGFNNEMIAFDDHSATINNPAVRDFDVFGRFNLGMYAPLTWLGYAVAYALGGKEAFWYHLLSALVHAANTVLVFRLFRRLSAANAVFAGTVALFFALHPLQVESVSWIAGFSTPMFSLFYLLALDFYVGYTGTEGKMTQLWIALGLFLLACLAKTAAVTLPLTFLVLDGWLKRPISRKTVLEKIPFFLVSLGFGLLTLYSRSKMGHTVSPANTKFDLSDRFFMACETVFFYWKKVLIPSGLSIWYPFEKTAEGGWAWWYYAAPVALAAVLFGAWRWRNALPVLWYGLLFYLSCIILSLPYYTIGTFELRSDRYNYLAVLGLFAILASLPFFAGRKNPGLKLPVWIALAVLTLFWTNLTLKRIRDWQNSITLINRAVAATGDNFGQAYMWLGMEYANQAKGPQALEQFNKAISKNPDLIEAYRYRGMLLGLAKQYEKSVEDLDKYLQRYPNNAEITFNRAISWLKLGRNTEALRDLNRTLELNPGFERAYQARADVYRQLGDTLKAREDLEKMADLKKK